MKKITILFAFLISSSLFISCGNGTGSATSKINKDNLESAKSRDVEIKNGAASISFESTEYDFGTVNEGDIVETTFKVTNSGTTDLVITDAKVTCGCTVPVWPKKPIKPGQTEDVQVKFNTNGKQNRQQKNITLITNTETGREILTLKGMVTPKAK
ncbi:MULTISPECIES: DUF1573 domain-containing protein [unclassified Polaribacter]|uniref:DUF1573 domain-containing protein n=1 Tax=unclassified Polaribacter TaxID=196858 RepID=UPI0011BD92CD|nr:MULTISPECIES: DUF1573 domain-containing protein [unclassified Polaribacter]TXD50687.1 DUF1573 domain-containing protein [Polaribacter sp. IC063]TXD58418.1 DUF1573 domain-containing protein [Polaribacter sp. IC066]